MTAIAVAAALLILALLHRLAWIAISLGARSARRYSPAFLKFGGRLRDHRQTQRLATRYPRLHGFLVARLDPRAFSGLPLSLMIAGALYIAALFGGLVEDLLTEDGVHTLDTRINAFLGPYRAKPLLTGFLWLTNLGASPAVAAVAIVATGFLWASRRLSVIVALWVTLLGAEATSWAGKFLIGRTRPEFLDVASASSPSFPSGHTTASMAVYGFLAYAIARQLPDLRGRFEVAFWAAVLIAMIGFSRMFLSVHYASDVLSGFLVGGFWLLVGFVIAESNKAKLPS